MADYLLKALIVILAIDVMLFLGQIAVINVSAEVGTTPINFFNVNTSNLAEAGDVNTYTVNTSNPGDKMFTTTPAVDTGGGGWFTDTVKDIKNWFVEQIPGVKYFFMIVGAPASFLSAIGAPAEVVFAIGGLWYLFTIVVVIAFIAGRGS